jgi:hypothetical protein
VRSAPRPTTRTVSRVRGGDGECMVELPVAAAIVTVRRHAKTHAPAHKHQRGDVARGMDPRARRQVASPNRNSDSQNLTALKRCCGDRRRRGDARDGQVPPRVALPVAESVEDVSSERCCVEVSVAST